MTRVEEQIVGVREQLTGFKDDICELKDNHLHAIQQKLDELARKISARPAWSVTILISSLLTLVGVLLTALLRR